MVKPAAPRMGFSVLEALLALMLLTIVLPVGWTLLIRHRAAGVDVAQRAEAVETVRTVAWLLAQETSVGRPGIDWRVSSGDSLRIRAFRSLGLVEEGSQQGGWIRVCSRDVRVPVPQKDSVLVLGSDGRWRLHDLLDRRTTSTECPEGTGERVQRWELSPQPAEAILARVFESGSYHFADGALRYRRGEGGRQPLTPERIHMGQFFSPEASESAFSWEMTLRGGTMPTEEAGIASVLYWRGGVW